MKTFLLFVLIVVSLSLSFGQVAVRLNHYNMQTVADSVVDVIDGTPGCIFSKTTSGNERLLIENMSDGQSFYLVVKSATADTITWVTSITWLSGTTPIHGLIGTSSYFFAQAGGTIYGSESGSPLYAPKASPTLTGTTTVDTLDVLRLTQFTGPVAFSAGSGIRKWVDSLTALHADTLAIWIAGTPWIVTKVRATP